MRSLWIVLAWLFLVGFASATDLNIKVIDPNSSAVAGAQVSLLRTGAASPFTILITPGDGVLAIRIPDERSLYQVEILAAGFAPESTTVEGTAGNVTIQLRVAAVTETVVVTATRTPVQTSDAGASVDTLENAQLEAMQPVAASDAIRFLPGAVVNAAGQRGGLSSLFVRGGDSRYNKVIIDDVPVNEPGGTYDFGVVPLANADRMEFVRGAQSTLYGSDAMTSVVQVFTRNGSTATPELRFGADGGTFGTAHGYATLSGARGRFDYSLFGDQFNTNGQGPNDRYSNSLVGANVGVALSDHVLLRTRVRHFNAWAGVPGEWKFNNAPLQPPDSDQHARQNTLLASVQLVISGPSRWQHRLTGFEYNLHRQNVDTFADPDRIFDFPFHNINDTNRAGFDYQGDYQARSWARTTIGYQFEDENGFVGDQAAPFHGLRLNHAVFGQQALQWRRLSLIAGVRFAHNETFGNKAVPRASLTIQALKGGDVFSGTQFRFSYATGIKESRFDEAFANIPGLILPNPNLKAEENRAFEAGIQQALFGGKYSVSAVYYNNLYRNQIDFAILDPNTFLGQYQNIDKSLAHGAEFELKGRITSRISLNGSYVYTSTQILEQPFAFDDLHRPGRPLIRRPRHLGSLLVNYLGTKWGANLGGSFVGRRPDSDFLIFNIDHAAGYALVNAGGWYAIHPRITAYLNVDNALNQHYNEVVGYPALTVNFRAGLRFRIGGD